MYIILKQTLHEKIFEPLAHSLRYGKKIIPTGHLKTPPVQRYTKMTSANDEVPGLANRLLFLG